MTDVLENFIEWEVKCDFNQICVYGYIAFPW